MANSTSDEKVSIIGLDRAFTNIRIQALETEEPYIYPYLQGTEYEKKEMTKALNVLRQSAVGRELLEDAEKHQTTIGFEHMVSAHGSYNDESNLVLIQSSSNSDRVIATLAHELRHAQQFQRGVLLNSMKDAPKNYLHCQSAIEADASATACLVSWQLKEKGFPAPYTHLQTDYKELAIPFEKEMSSPAGTPEKALKAAFKGWFNDLWKREAYEKNYIKNYEYNKNKAKMSERETAFSRAVPIADNVAKFALLDGKPYLSKKEVEEHYAQPELSCVTHETYWAIYRNLRDVRRFDFFTDATEIMGENGEGFTERPGGDYFFESIEKKNERTPEGTNVMPPKNLKDLEVRHHAAISKIKAIRSTAPQGSPQGRAAANNGPKYPGTMPAILAKKRQKLQK